MKLTCHHTAHKKPCVKEQCPLWTHLRGTNPQTGEPMDRYGCADAFTPLLLVDLARQVGELTASVQSQRNVTAQGIDALRRTLKQLPTEVNNE